VVWAGTTVGDGTTDGDGTMVGVTVGDGTILGVHQDGMDFGVGIDLIIIGTKIDQTITEVIPYRHLEILLVAILQDQEQQQVELKIHHSKMLLDKQELVMNK
jgi:hypothetical protein